MAGNPGVFEKPKYTSADRDKTIERKGREIVRATVSDDGVRDFCNAVDYIIQTVKPEEKWAVLENVKSPNIAGRNKILCLDLGDDDIEADSIYLGKIGVYSVAVVVTRMGSQCHDAMKDAIIRFPHAEDVILVGIAYSRDKNFADILVSEWIKGMDDTRHESDHSIVACPDNPADQYTMPLTNRLRKLFTLHIEEWQVTHGVKFDCTTTGRHPKVHVGVILSSPTLLRNQESRDKFILNARRAIGGEMEGLEVVKLRNRFAKKNREFGVMIIKGVADRGDATKDDKWHFTASLAAAKYMADRLKEGH